MKKAADDLYEDYITDKELTAFTNLDLKSKDWWDTLKKEEIDWLTIPEPPQPLEVKSLRTI